MGCKTLKNSTTTYKNSVDTVYISKNFRDSIYLKDSIYIDRFEKGDTVFVTKDKWHTKYIDKSRIDTVYTNKSDTCYVENIQTVTETEIPKWIWWILGVTGSITLFVLIRAGLKIYTKIQTGGITNLITKILK